MRKLSILGFALLLAGCAALKPAYTKPAVDLPAARASGAGAHAVLTTRPSHGARRCFALRAFAGQLAATRRSLAARSESLGMQKKRFAVGDISESDYRQLQADVAAERALLPVL